MKKKQKLKDRMQKIVDMRHLENICRCHGSRKEYDAESIDVRMVDMQLHSIRKKD